jgi:hypothetical protein
MIVFLTPSGAKFTKKGKINAFVLLNALIFTILDQGSPCFVDITKKLLFMGE